MVELQKKIFCNRNEVLGFSLQSLLVNLTLFSLSAQKHCLISVFHPTKRRYKHCDWASSSADVRVVGLRRIKPLFYIISVMRITLVLILPNDPLEIFLDTP